MFIAVMLLNIVSVHQFRIHLLAILEVSQYQILDFGVDVNLRKDRGNHLSLHSGLSQPTFVPSFYLHNSKMFNYFISFIMGYDCMIIHYISVGEVK